MRDLIASFRGLSVQLFYQARDFDLPSLICRLAVMKVAAMSTEKDIYGAIPPSTACEFSRHPRSERQIASLATETRRFLRAKWRLRNRHRFFNAGNPCYLG